MSGTTINRGEASAIPFVITDANSGLAGKRVTFVVGRAVNVAPILRKVGALPGSSADLTIAGQTGAQITGTVNIVAADFATLTKSSYPFSLWIDDGAGNERCVTVNGSETLTINDDVPRT